MVEINETPVRTSKNYNINSLKLNTLEIPKAITEFKNKTIAIDSDEVENCSLSSEKIDLTYGLSEELTEQIALKRNQETGLIIKSKNNSNIKIDYKLDENNNNLIDFINIVANRDTKATIFIKYMSDEVKKAFHNGIIKINAKPNSEINVVVINLLNNDTENFLAIQNIIEDNAKINYTIIDFGGKNSVTNYYSNLIGSEADNRLNAIYIGKDEQVLDLNYIAELRGQKSNVNIDVQGALKDNARKHFKGTIDFKKGCKKASGNENESCMLLSDTAKAIALPMLLCSEEDVKGEHSTSAGKIEENELFYIMSRGFEQKEAMKLMVRAKFNNILENIKDEKLKQEILEEIDIRLD